MLSRELTIRRVPEVAASCIAAVQSDAVPRRRARTFAMLLVVLI
jgi:hypothetical protein